VTGVPPVEVEQVVGLNLKLWAISVSVWACGLVYLPAFSFSLVFVGVRCNLAFGIC
jgi:hypothetical protein